MPCQPDDEVCCGLLSQANAKLLLQIQERKQAEEVLWRKDEEPRPS